MPAQDPTTPIEHRPIPGFSRRYEMGSDKSVWALPIKNRPYRRLMTITRAWSEEVVLLNNGDGDDTRSKRVPVADLFRLVFPEIAPPSVDDITSFPDVIFADISGAPGYKVGNDGSVWCSSRKSSIPGHLRWKRLKPSIDDDGYCRVVITQDGRKRKKMVHALVLEAFVGPRPEGMQACHFPDPDRTNNNLKNLRWDTPKSNIGDREIRGNTARGSRCGMAKLKENDILEIRRLYAIGTKRAAIARMFGISHTHVTYIVRRYSWAHL